MRTLFLIVALLVPASARAAIPQTEQTPVRVLNAVTLSTSAVTTVGRTGRPKIIMATLTAGTTGFTGSVSGISLYANGADATFTVAMGSSSLSGTTSPTMTLRSGIGISMNPDYAVYSATVTWISGTLDVIIEGTVP